MLEVRHKITDDSVSAACGRTEVIISRDCPSGGCSYCTDVRTQGDTSLAETLFTWLAARETVMRLAGSAADLRREMREMREMLAAGLLGLAEHRRAPARAPRPHDNASSSAWPKDDGVRH